MDRTMECLAERYREAWRVARRVPSGLNLGHASFWPELNPNRWEIYHAEGMKPRPTQPSVEATERMVECMRWLRWLDEDERQLVWLRAAGLPWRDIAKKTGLPKTTASRHWHRALLKISLRLPSPVK